MLNALILEWKRPFLGSSVDVLRKLLLDEEMAFQEDQYYAKVMPIIQSSGTGKSRLLDEMSKEFLTISFTLRGLKDYGFPPADHEVTGFLAHPNADYEELNARAMALLSMALIECRGTPLNSSCSDMLICYFQ
jgi:hypothetical protein